MIATVRNGPCTEMATPSIRANPAGWLYRQFRMRGLIVFSLKRPAKADARRLPKERAG